MSNLLSSNHLDSLSFSGGGGTRIRRLCLSQGEFLHAQALNPWAKHCPNLRFLEVVNCGVVSDEMFVGEIPPLVEGALKGENAGQFLHKIYAVQRWLILDLEGGAPLRGRPAVLSRLLPAGLLRTKTDQVNPGGFQWRQRQVPLQDPEPSFQREDGAPEGDQALVGGRGRVGLCTGTYVCFG